MFGGQKQDRRGKSSCFYPCAILFLSICDLVLFILSKFPALVSCNNFGVSCNHLEYSFFHRSKSLLGWSFLWQIWSCLDILKEHFHCPPSPRKKIRKCNFQCVRLLQDHNFSFSLGWAVIISYTFPSYHTHRPRRGEGDVVDMIRRVQERVAI